MFFGSYSYNIDDKGRIVIPSKFRQEAGEKLYLMRGFDGCISLYKTEDFIRYVEEVKKLPKENAKSRAYLRLLLSSTVELSIDKQGRSLIPKETLKKFGFDNNIAIMFVGQIDHIEVWQLEEWENYQKLHEDSYEEDAEELFSNHEVR